MDAGGHSKGGIVVGAWRPERRSRRFFPPWFLPLPLHLITSAGTTSRSFASTIAGVASPLRSPAFTSWFLIVLSLSQPRRSPVVDACAGSVIFSPFVVKSGLE